MVTFLTTDGDTVALMAAHVESLVTLKDQQQNTRVTMVSGASFDIAAGSREVATRLASVLRGE